MGLRVLHCANYHPNCSAEHQPIDANPDIAGIGVIVGFLTTTCLAFLTSFAVLFLQRYGKIVFAWRKYISQRGHPTPYDFDKMYTKENAWRSAEFWSRVLSKNLLSISDTQLVTGLAIQFTAMLQHCKLTIYHFQIVTELAFLTTVTHLLTVVTLRNYFVDHRWINLPRIISMLGNLALLGYTSFVAYSYDLAGLELSSSLACFYQGERPRFKAAFGGRWAALIIGAIGGHVTIILAMYVLPDNIEEIKNKSRKWKGWKWLGTILRTWIIAPVYAIYGFVMAGYSLGKTQALGKASVEIRGSEKDWGFGQFLPILLLALPLFAGWESFWEEKDPNRDLRFVYSSRPSRVELEMSPRNKSPRVQGGTSSSRDISPLDMEERRTQNNVPSPIGTPRIGLSPAGTPRIRHSSGPAVSPRQSPQASGALPSPSVTPLSSPNLEVPSPLASPRGRSGSGSGSERERTIRGSRDPFDVGIGGGMG